MKNQSNNRKTEGFQPSRPIAIDLPCNESWEAMPGDHRRRFCARCEQHVLNTAAMTPAALETVLAAPGPAPCLRVVQYADGSFRTAREAQAAPLGLGRLGAWAASAFVSLSSLTAVAQQPTMGAPRPVETPATLIGEVHGPDGKPAAGVQVTLGKENATASAVRVTTDANGRFSLQAMPGRWYLRAEKATPLGRLGSASVDAELHAGTQRAPKVLQLEPERIMMGAIAPPRAGHMPPPSK